MIKLKNENMRFNVPQFIEYETKIIGPLTFKQFIFIGTAGVIVFFVYFSAPFTIFLIVSIVAGGLAMALAFLKIGGVSLPTILVNVLKFSSVPKIYIWQKKEQPAIKVYKKMEPPSAEAPEGEKEELPLKIAEKSRLKKLRTEIETRTK